MATQWATTGTAQGAGDGSSEANRIELKKVIEDDAALASALAAGDIINCKDDGELVYDGSAGVFATATVSGTEQARIQIRPYTTSADDGGFITIRDSNNGATSGFFTLSADYWSFERIMVEDCRQGWVMGTTGGHQFSLCSCRAGFPAIGWSRGASTQAPCQYDRCYAYNHLDGWLDNGLVGTFINCSAIQCVDGFSLEAATHQGTMVGCIAHDCTTGYKLAGGWAMINCIANGCSGNGIFYSQPDSPITLVNTASTNNGGYGLAAASTTQILAINCALNPTNAANTSGDVDSNVDLHEHGSVSTDPEFVDDSPGDPEDVNLTSVPWVNLGIGRHPFESTSSTFPIGPGDDGDPASSGGVVIPPWEFGKLGINLLSDFL